MYNDLQYILNNYELDRIMKTKNLNIQLNIEQIFIGSYLLHNKNWDKIIYSDDIPNFV